MKSSSWSFKHRAKKTLMLNLFTCLPSSLKSTSNLHHVSHVTQAVSVDIRLFGLQFAKGFSLAREITFAFHHWVAI